MESLSTAAKPLISIGKALVPYLKQLHAERQAGQDSPSTQTTLLDTSLEETFNRLHDIEAHESWWQEILQLAEAAYVRPDYLATPSIQEWLGKSAVRDDFKALAHAQLLSGSVEETAIRDRLAKSYSIHTLEAVQLAAGPIEAVVNILLAGTLAQVSKGDRFVAGLLQKSQEQTIARLDRITRNVEARVIERIQILQNDLKRNIEEWATISPFDTTPRTPATQIVTIRAAAVPRENIELVIDNNPLVAPVVSPVDYVWDDQDVSYEGWATASRSNMPDVGSVVRCCTTYDNLAVFDRIYEDGAVSLVTIYNNAERAWITGRATIRFNIGNFLLHIATIIRTIERVRRAAKAKETEYELSIDLDVVGSVRVFFPGDQSKNDLRFPNDAWLRQGHTEFRRYRVGEAATFRATVNSVARDFIRAMQIAGLPANYDWKVDFESA